jgi:Tol biopolymer transport system component
VASTIAVKAWHAGWSPDGSRIAFLRVERGFGRSLFVASSDGPAVTRVASHLGWVIPILVVAAWI